MALAWRLCFPACRLIKRTRISKDRKTETMTALKPRASITSLIRYKPNLTTGRSGPVIRLSANEGALGPSPNAIDAMSRVMGEMHRYPSVDSSGLAEAIARKHGIDADRIVFGCGSDELISLVCQAYLEPGDEAIHTQYGFVMFPHATTVAGGVPVVAADNGFTVSVDNILDKVGPRTRIVFLANPNNPTGTYIPRDEVQRLRDGLRDDILLVLDAAYAEFVSRNDYADGIEFVEANENVVMLRTFSKLYALAGMRLGWGYMPHDVAAVLHGIKAPFSVSIPALAAGLAAIEDQAFEDRSLSHNRVMVDWTSQKLGALGLEVCPTVTNFFLTRFPDEQGRTAGECYAYCAERNILLRQMDAYGLPDYLRMSVGTEEEMLLVVNTVAAFLGQEPVSA